eukprot:8291253-Lingulodinium_polyedra.AAC.1
MELRAPPIAWPRDRFAMHCASSVNNAAASQRARARQCGHTSNCKRGIATLFPGCLGRGPGP